MTTWVQYVLMKAEEKVLLYLEHLYREGTIDPYDEHIRAKLDGLSPKQILRDMRALSLRHGDIVEERANRKIRFRLVKPKDILLETFRHDTLGIGMLFEMAKEGMPDILASLHTVALRDNKPYLFFHMPYEDIEQLEQNENFHSLKLAVERHEYRTIRLKGGKIFADVKPLKLLFSEGNWYIAYLDAQELRISRISFIDKVSYGTKNNYRTIDIAKALQWLENAYQNPFSRYGKEVHTATLLARPNIAHYFDKGMKPFFKSQRFIEKTEEGSVRFCIDYTQPKEILPFIQRWLPDLIIETPVELKEEYHKKLQEALSIMR